MRDVKFISAFSDKYARSNRGQGMKYLQCFPGCGVNGHTSRGFCGSTVALSFKHPPGFVLESLHAIGTFSVCGESDGIFFQNNEIAASSLSGRFVSQKPISQIGQHDSTAHLYKGEIFRQTHDTAEIHFSSMGWHYGWVSHKTKTNTVHDFRVYLLLSSSNSTPSPKHATQEADQKLTCMSMCHSPPFR
jgi:hypothetical protein